MGLKEKLTTGLKTAKYDVTPSVRNEADKGQMTLSRTKANAGNEVKIDC